MFVKAAFLLSLTFFPVSSATGADIVTALQNVTNGWEAVSDALAAPPTTLVAFLTVHNDLVLIRNATDSATSTVVTTDTLSVADGRLILPVFQNLCATVVPAAVRKLVTDVPFFKALPVSGVTAVLLQDLSNIDTSTNNLASRLVDNAPDSLRSDFESAALACEQLVQTCVEAYTSAG